MRLHHLEVSAFGPFAGDVAVDFDALSAAGLFLLTGPTGAGKTSVLDAVCFALYGEVPGDRQAAKRLRSDQADDGVRPRVALELTLMGRRFRVERSPVWQRPKKRGSGWTTEQPSVRLTERRDGAWHPLSHRLDETGHLVTHLVGMNLTQFCQVAMLPQGRFQAFLRARSDDRHTLLQQLFRTSRFQDVERWLGERRRELRRRSARHHELVADLVSRVSECADSTLPDAWDLHDLAAPAATGDLDAWATGQRELARRRAAEAVVAVGHAADATALARAALDQGRRLADRQRAHTEAVAERERLTAEASRHAERQRRVAAARRAAEVRPLHDVVVRLERSHRDAVRDHTERMARAAVLLDASPEVLTDDTILEAGRRATEAAAALRALRPREQALVTLRTDLRASEARVAELNQQLHEVDQQLAALPGEVSRLRAAHGEAARAQQALSVAAARVAALRRRRSAAAELASLTAELTDARERRSVVVDELHQLKDAWQQIQHQRIEGMAAELAGALAVGHDCPVCGSVEHPQPATARPGAPDAATEKAARRRVDDAESARLAHDELVRDLTTRVAVAREQADGEGDPDDVLPEAEAELDRLSATAEAGPGLDEDIATAEADLARLTTTRETASSELAGARTTLKARRAEARAIQAELAAHLDRTGFDSLGDLARHHDGVATACDVAAHAAREADRAEAAAVDAHRAAQGAAVAAGFADLAAALDAALSPEAVHALEAELAAHDAAVAATEKLLADAELRAAAAVPPPDLASLDDDHARHAELLATTQRVAALAEARAQRLDALVDQLGESGAQWAPVRDELELATRMAALADGTSPDNRLQMRLSGYVLAWRLAQVVAAANERLAHMSDQRYSLEHTGRKGAGETRGGLSLLVRDDWSGETRDPATLSGGETFVVSLALALGLADVIAHEVGGAELDTLFVDEGFGSLDADTLDDVMDTLDSLRDGGRVVGVVSHVAEMRDRIPAQLRVTKSRRGSTLALAR